jgi:glycosyltransferase involved in cell wall biosynthesis
LRILFLNVVSVIGGAERVLLDAMTSLGEMPHPAELHLVVPTEGPLVNAARSLGVIVHLLPMPAALAGMGDSALRDRGRVQALGKLIWHTPRALAAAARYADALGSLVRSVQPDVVHSNSLKFHLLARWARLANVPVVWHVHDFLSTRPLMAWGLRWAASSAQAAIAISNAVAADTRTLLGQCPVAVVPNAIDTNRFNPVGAAADLDALAGLGPAPPGTLRIGLVATYARWKGQDVFLQASKHVLKQLPGDTRFYVIGGPIYQTQGSQWALEDLRSLVANLPADRVGFVGFQANTADIYRALDVVVHASTRPEPFGLTIVEAMACGRAVIVAKSGGAAELFMDNHDAIGVNPGDATALAEAIGSLLLDPALRRRLGETARASAVNRFARQRLGPQLLNVYSLAIGTPVGTQGPNQGPPSPNGGSSQRQAGPATKLTS